MGNHPENACYDTMVLEQFNFNTLRLVIWKKLNFISKFFQLITSAKSPENSNFISRVRLWVIFSFVNFHVFRKVHFHEEFVWELVFNLRWQNSSGSGPLIKDTHKDQ